MAEQVQPAWFVQLGAIAVAVDHILAVEVSDPEKPESVTVFLDAPMVSVRGEVVCKPHAVSVEGDLAARFWDWWQRQPWVCKV